MNPTAPWTELLGEWNPLPTVASWLAARGYRATGLLSSWERALSMRDEGIIDLWSGPINQLRDAVAAAASRAGRRTYPDQLDDLIVPILRALAEKEAGQ
jgi:hypothetical protein